MVVSRAGGRKIQNQQQYLVVTESEEVYRKNGACLKDAGANLEEFPMAKAGII